jgi:hypothetical protein
MPEAPPVMTATQPDDIASSDIGILRLCQETTIDPRYSIQDTRSNMTRAR